VPETGLAAEGAGIGSVTLLAGCEAEAIATEVAPMLENEATAAAVDQQEAEPIAGDDITVGDIAPVTVPDLQTVPVGSVEEIGSAAADVGSVEETEPVAADVGSVEETEPVAVEEIEPMAVEMVSVERQNLWLPKWFG
jgi:hypothetical protein